jgi:hypothetical protein
VYFASLNDTFILGVNAGQLNQKTKPQSAAEMGFKERAEKCTWIRHKRSERSHFKRIKKRTHIAHNFEI